MVSVAVGHFDVAGMKADCGTYIAMLHAEAKG
jgi:hypothetical protein